MLLPLCCTDSHCRHEHWRAAEKRRSDLHQHRRDIHEADTGGQTGHRGRCEQRARPVDLPATLHRDDLDHEVSPRRLWQQRRDAETGAEAAAMETYRDA